MDSFQSIERKKKGGRDLAASSFLHPLTFTAGDAVKFGAGIGWLKIQAGQPPGLLKHSIRTAGEAGLSQKL
jgi:hypothetical protein